MTSQVPRLVLSLLAGVTLVLTAGGALGLWPTGTPAAAWNTPGQMRPAAAPVPARAMEGTNGDVARDDAGSSAAAPQADPSAPLAAEPDSATSSADAEPALPADSGSGRRVVFDMGEQRVWLVGSEGQVRRTYLVSGSATDNLGPGTYEVYSRSRHAVSYTYEETMRFMVRFAHGQNAAIGFHDIPLDEKGHRIQTREQLGQRLSSGCIRQARPDAVALWKFADVGTPVVVVR